MQLTEQLVNRIVACKHQFRIAEENARSQRDATLPAAICNLQDSVESFLHALAEHFHAPLPERADFDKYFSIVGESIKKRDDLKSYDIPYKVSLLRMNKMRVNAKHHGVLPERDDLNRLIITVRAFFDDVCRDVFSINFSTISLTDILNDGEIKYLLSQAEKSFLAGDYANCLISCRKAIYLQIENRFDIRRFEQGYSSNSIGFMTFCSAPYYTQNAEYIAERVETPFDYIQIDHSALDMILVKDGIDHVVYWNIWRLTPEVYNCDGNWLVRYDYNKLIEDGIRDRAEYVLEKTIDIMISVHMRKLRLQMLNHWVNYTLPESVVPVCVYRKSDKNSEVLSVISPFQKDIQVSSFGPGLRGDGDYWHVHFIIEVGGNNRYISGYVFNNDIYVFNNDIKEQH